MNIDTSLPFVILVDGDQDKVVLEPWRPSSLSMPVEVLASARDGIVKGFEVLDTLESRNLVQRGEEAKLVVEVAQDHLDGFWKGAGIRVLLLTKFNMAEMRSVLPRVSSVRARPLSKREKQRIDFLLKKAEEQWSKLNGLPETTGRRCLERAQAHGEAAPHLRRPAGVRARRLRHLVQDGGVPPPPPD